MRDIIKFMKNKTIVITILVLLAIIGGTVWLIKVPTGPGQYDEFAKCLGDKGATFYGAFWCPHCRNQKAIFGKSASLLPYVECSMPDGNTQNQACNDKKITGYPTWEFAGGERVSGEVSLATLAEKTKCELPK